MMFAPSLVVMDRRAMAASSGSSPPAETAAAEKPSGMSSTASTLPDSSSLCASSADISCQLKLFDSVLSTSFSVSVAPRSTGSAGSPSVVVAGVAGWSLFTMAALMWSRRCVGSSFDQMSEPA